jgi:chorismate dehydratase
MTLNVGLMPYLNSALFYFRMAAGAPGNGVVLHPMVPTVMAQAAAEGGLDAGPIPLVDCFKLEESFEPLGGFCIATTERARSILLFSRAPVEELGGRVVGVTDETSTSARLLRVLLRHRYGIVEPRYVGLDEAHDAFLLIGDGALKQRRGVPGYPHRYDLGEVWRRWTGLPTVFALWIVRKSVPQAEKEALREAIAHSIQEGWGQWEELAAQRPHLGMTAADVEEYLTGFSFVVGPPEREAISRFRSLLSTLAEEERVSHGRHF